jgi:hypothetical protein
MARARLGTIAVVITAAVGASIVFAMSQPAESASYAAASEQPTAVQRIRDLALKIAAVNGESHPTSVELVATTRAKAMAVATPGDSVPNADNQDVYLVRMTGHFTGYAVSVPPGAPKPKGTILSIVIDGQSLERRISSHGITTAGARPGCCPAGRWRTPRECASGG